MKNKLIALLATAGMVSSVSAIDINDNLQINGFIDGSYKHVDTDGIPEQYTATTANAAGDLDPSETDQGLGLDEAELNFITNVGDVTGVINIDTGTFNGVELEQAHITYALDNGVSFTLGKYGSGLGFEGEDPTGLYTFSRAYSAGSGFNFKNIDNEAQHAVEGLSVGYASDVFSIAASFENAGDTDGEEDELNLELSFSYTGIDNLTIGGGAFFDNQTTNGNETDAINLHASTTLGKIFLAVEYTELDASGTNPDLDGWLVLADYDFNDKLGVAFRVSSNELDGQREYEKVTLAPNYAITDSLGAILEYSDVENRGQDGNELALEFLYTF